MAVLKSISKYKKHIAIGVGTAMAVGGGAYVYKKRRKPVGKKKSSGRPMSPTKHAVVGGLLLGVPGAIGGYYYGKHRNTKYNAARRAVAKRVKTRAARSSGKVVKLRKRA